MTTYRTHWNSTYDIPIHFCAEHWHNECIESAHVLAPIMGLENYNNWVDANLPDGPIDWQKLYGILEAKLDEELERINIIKEGEARRDWLDMKAEDPQ